MRITSVNKESQNIEVKNNSIITNESIKNRIKEIQLHNTEIGNFCKFFESRDVYYLVYELATYGLNNKLEILTVSRNRNLID